ncbi:MAG: hypothetical protein WKF63_06940 [Thermomicrobiales bacterium]
MSWSIVLGVAIGLVVGINLGVLLMVALQAGRRQEQSYDEQVLLARIKDLEQVSERQVARSGPSMLPGPIAVVDDSSKADRAGSHRVTG